MAAFRAFLFSFAAGLITLFSGQGVYTELTYQPPEAPLQTPINIPNA